MIRTCKVKLGRAPKQEAKLTYVLGLCCDLYNAALQQRRDAWAKQKVSLSYYAQTKELTQLRADDEEYRRLPAQMTRMTSLYRVDRAFQGFCGRCRRGENPGFPRFRSRDRFSTLMFSTQDWRIKGKSLILKNDADPIVLQMRNTIHHEGQIKGLRVVRSATRWWAHFLVDVGPTPAVKKSDHGVGIDVGLRTFATLSDGNVVEHPRFLKQSLEQLKSVQQELSRKKRGSKNRAKAKLVVARVHEKIANRRRDFVHQTVSSLVKKYDGFALEKLDVCAMTSTERKVEGLDKKQSRGLRRGIMDSGWSLFGAHLASKAEEAGLPVVHVDPKGTSQRCSACGTIVRKTLRDRVHECFACGLVLDRDENAARNIYDLGLRSASGSAATASCAEGAEVL